MLLCENKKKFSNNKFFLLVGTLIIMTAMQSNSFLQFDNI